MSAIWMRWPIPMTAPLSINFSVGSISQGQFTINGFRNRDIQALLYPIPTTSEQESRRRSAAISRKLRLLRAHYLIRKVPSSYRYQLTPLGRQIITAILAAGHAPVKSFMAKAA